MKLSVSKPLAALCLLAGGCAGRPAPVRTEFQPVYINVPAVCPDPLISDQLIADRPTPLREAAKPSDPSVRSAKSQAQLGKYEAEGGWADKVVAALKRCQLQ